MVTLRRQAEGVAGADGASPLTAGRALVAVHDWTFLFGPIPVAGSLAALLVFAREVTPAVRLLAKGFDGNAG